MGAPGDRQRSRAELADLAVRLISDYSDRLPAGAVLSCVARCNEELRRTGMTVGLAAATEAMARVRLDARMPPHVGVDKREGCHDARDR
jgi:hypothetical protein